MVLLLAFLLSLSFVSFPVFSSGLTATAVSLESQHKHNEHLSKTSHSQLRVRILEQYQQWKGTDYSFGGTTHYGLDCSSLMQHMLQGAAHVDLPRTTSEQMRRGVRVSKLRLMAGDLIFFRTGIHQRHVGIYIGGHKFIHASRIQGVTISVLNSYWQRRYITARRVAGHAV